MRLSSLTIVVLIIVTTYSLFFIFQVSTELRVRSALLEQSRYQYETLATKFADELSSDKIVNPNGSTDVYDLQLSKIFDNFLNQEGYPVQVSSNGIDSSEASYSSIPSSYKAIPHAAVIDSEGHLLWSSAREVSIIANPDNTANLVSTMSDKASTASLVELVDDSQGQSKAQFLIAVSNPIGAKEIFSNTTQADRNYYRAILWIPVTSIYSQFDDILFSQRLQTFTLVAAISVITIVMAFYINRSSRLGKEALEKAEKLQESYKIISEQQQSLQTANQELRNLDAAKDHFIAIASHELKSPILPILAFADLAGRGRLDKDRALHEILKNARLLKKLALDLLDVTKIDTNKFTFSFEIFSLSELLQEVIDSSKVSNTRGEVTLELSFGSSDELKPESHRDLRIYGDRTRLFQAIANLVSNSLKFTKIGYVRITVEKFEHERNCVVIVVSDTGPGIPKDLLPHIFDKFVSSSSNENNRQGTGLGLYVAKSIIDAHHGKIEVQSTAASPNGQNGTRFIITLPITGSAAALQAKPLGVAPNEN